MANDGLWWQWSDEESDWLSIFNDASRAGESWLKLINKGAWWLINVENSSSWGIMGTHVHKPCGCLMTPATDEKPEGQSITSGIYRQPKWINHHRPIAPAWNHYPTLQVVYPCCRWQTFTSFGQPWVINHSSNFLLAVMNRCYNYRNLSISVCSVPIKLADRRLLKHN